MSVAGQQFDPRNAKAHYAAVRARLCAAPPKPVVIAPARPAATIVVRKPNSLDLSEGQRIVAKIQWCAAADKLTQMERRRSGTRKILVQDVVRWVSEDTGVSLNAMFSPRRNHRLVRVRQLAMWLSSELTEASLPEMGRRIGGRDHTTILHGIRKMQSLIDAGELPDGFADIIARRMAAVPARADT